MSMNHEGLSAILATATEAWFDTTAVDKLTVNEAVEVFVNAIRDTVARFAHTVACNHAKPGDEAQAAAAVCAAAAAAITRVDWDMFMKLTAKDGEPAASPAEE